MNKPILTPKEANRIINSGEFCVGPEYYDYSSKELENLCRRVKEIGQELDEIQLQIIEIENSSCLSVV